MAALLKLLVFLTCLAEMQPSKGMIEYMAEINRLFPKNEHDVQDTGNTSSSIFHSTLSMNSTFNSSSSPPRHSITDSFTNLSPIRSDAHVSKSRLFESYGCSNSNQDSLFSSSSIYPKHDWKSSPPKWNDGGRFQNSLSSTSFNSFVDDGLMQNHHDEKPSGNSHNSTFNIFGDDSSMQNRQYYHGGKPFKNSHNSTFNIFGDDIPMKNQHHHDDQPFQNRQSSTSYSFVDHIPTQNICDKLFPSTEPAINKPLIKSEDFTKNSTPKPSKNHRDTIQSIFANQPQFQQSYITCTPTQNVQYAFNVPPNITFTQAGDYVSPNPVTFTPTVNFVPTSVNLAPNVNFPLTISVPSNILPSPNCSGLEYFRQNNENSSLRGSICFQDELKSSKMCTFCRKNGETPLVYSNHVVKKKVNGKTIVTCPILRSLVCKMCGVHGDDAHTLTYCPLVRNTNSGSHPPSTTISLKSTRVKSNGKRRF